MIDRVIKPAPEALLTPSDVAELLQISEKTVYKHSGKFCGFRPAGLGILRFRKEIIYGIMEGQDPKTLVLQFPVSDSNLCRKRIPNKKGSGSSKGRKTERVENPTSIDRHGLLGSLQPLP